jgi:hypothetical protein
MPTSSATNASARVATKPRVPGPRRHGEEPRPGRPQTQLSLEQRAATHSWRMLLVGPSPRSSARGGRGQAARVRRLGAFSEVIRACPGRDCSVAPDALRARRDVVDPHGGRPALQVHRAEEHLRGGGVATSTAAEQHLSGAADIRRLLLDSSWRRSRDGRPSGAAGGHATTETLAAGGGIIRVTPLSPFSSLALTDRLAHPKTAGLARCGNTSL